MQQARSVVRRVAHQERPSRHRSRECLDGRRGHEALLALHSTCDIYRHSYSQLVPTVLYGDHYEWETDKAETNVRDHGVTFEEAATVLDAFGTHEAADPNDATRTITIGFSTTARALLVVSTERGDRTRIISARRATRRERSLLEKDEEP